MLSTTNDGMPKFDSNPISRQQYPDEDHQAKPSDVADVQALYQKTQEALKGKPDKTLYRGLTLDSSAEFKAGSEFKVSNSTSWTESISTADRYMTGGMDQLSEGDDAQVAMLHVTMPNGKIVAHYGLGTLDGTTARSDKEVVTGGMRLKIDKVQKGAVEDFENENGEIIQARKVKVWASVIE